jgi:hypothetical protein
MEGYIPQKPKMKRLCFFYKNAPAYVGKKIEWIICRQCNRKLRKGVVPRTCP